MIITDETDVLGERLIEDPISAILCITFVPGIDIPIKYAFSSRYKVLWNFAVVINL